MKWPPSLDDCPNQLISAVVDEDFPVEPLPDVEPWKRPLYPERCMTNRAFSVQEGLRNMHHHKHALSVTRKID
jgi:hypothetical protein